MEESNDGSDQLMIAIFSIGETKLGLDAGLVDEITIPPKITAVRGAMEWVVGIGNLRNRIITILDLGLRLGLGQTPRDARSRIVTTTVGGDFIGLLIPELPDVVQVDRARVGPIGNEVAADIREFFMGVLDFEDRMVPIVDAARALGPAVAAQEDERR